MSRLLLLCAVTTALGPARAQGVTISSVDPNVSASAACPGKERMTPAPTTQIAASPCVPCMAIALLTTIGDRGDPLLAGHGST